MLEGNLLIRASAGTGKTFALATRYIRLMLLGGVDPSKIVALTFSRAAAQEIYSKILERLRTAAESGENAAAESEKLCGDLGISKAWGTDEFASLLRRLVDAQHLGTIATLDSFILRMVRNFPLETGFQHAVEVLDGHGETEAVQDAVRTLLQNAGGGNAETFARTFLAANGGKAPRVLEFRIAQMLRSWRRFCGQNPDCRNWTVASMCQALGVPENSECPDLSDLPFCRIKRKNTLSIDEQFAERCRAYDGTGDVFDQSPGVKAFMLHFARNPDAVSYEYDYYRTHCVFDCGREGALKIRAALRHMFNIYAYRRLVEVKALIDFAVLVDDAYNRASRRKGKLTFSDFTRFSAAKEGSQRAFDLENLEYRFDEEFDHWALDEFQDTSELQWRCLRNLVSSAAGPDSGGRTVMAVGDLKQSIYTWRGGNDAPFKEMMSWKSFGKDEHGNIYGRIEDNATSYRYEKNICDFINKVFGPGNLGKPGTLPPERAKAVGRWLAEDCWKEHVPEKKNGREKDGDYVKFIGVPDLEGKAGVQSILQFLGNEVKRVWDAHEACGSDETVGILVRRNKEGNEIAEYLRSQGIPVAWEGLSSVADVPVVNALVDLLRLSEHPGDTFVWTSVSRLFPVVATLFPAPDGGGLTAAYVSKTVSAVLARQGLSRTLKEYCRMLSADAVGLDPLSKQRLHDMVAVAVAYEQRKADRFSVDGFERFLYASTMREQGNSPHVVRILTIHRSKGLTLDRVFVPVAEGTGTGFADPGGLLYSGGGNWVLPHVPEDTASLNPETSKAWNEMADERLLSNIRTYYVALTRAKKAMYVIAPFPEEGVEGCPFFRNVMAAAVQEFRRRDAGDGTWILFEQGAEPDFAVPQNAAADEAPRWMHCGPAVPVARVSPSSAGFRGTAVPDMAPYGPFSANAGVAARKGMEIHGRYEAVEWADEAGLAGMPPEFRAAFAKPDPGATVWREKKYEIYREEEGRGEWESGQFDRVVFTGRGDAREAVIYDFKTNASRSGETPEEFGRRMVSAYECQMKRYRAALSALTGIPSGLIRLVLLLQSTGKAVQVG